MNHKQAMAKLRALLGKNAHFELHPNAPDAEAREVLRAEARARGERFKALEKARMDRERELLADPQYRDLCRQAQEAKQARNEACWRVNHYRVVAGTRHGVGGLGFFSVEAEGDTLPEVIEKIEQKRKGANR